jgi:large subunit ribosomal protein L6
MSRIGKQPITIPAGVTIAQDKDFITVQGPKGSLKQFNLPGLKLSQADGQLVITREDDEAKTRARHGLMRSLVNNMVTGVSQGFEKKLEINGVGYRARLSGNDLGLSLGFSHEIVYKVPPEVSVSLEQSIITLSGSSKQLVGQVAAEIRALRKPEPYKGKGIKYDDERIIRKSGKSGKEQA